MRIALLTDMEGVAGLVNFKDWCSPGDFNYEKGRMLLTEEVNAAVRGFFDAGATEVCVIDGHGAGGIDTELLDRRALFARNWPEIHVFGLDGGYDAMAVVGQHAKAGTPYSHITHTGYFDVIDLRYNGISVGEYGECVIRAGHYGTPVIFASGERAFCKEAKELTPWVHTAETKYGVTPDDGRHCDTDEYANHNLGAVHVHPEVARERIYAGAKASLEELKANPEKFEVFRLEPPYIVETWLRKWGDIPPHKRIFRHDTNPGYAIFTTPEVLKEGEYKMPWEE